MKKFLKIFNILPDQNQKWILAIQTIVGLLLAYTTPAMSKLIISELPAQWISLEILVGAGMGLLVGSVWKGKTREVAARNFLILTTVESTIGFLVSMYIVFVDWNIWTLAITQLVYTSLISTFINKCIMMFKSKLWNDRGREIYDNNRQQVSGIVLLLGALVSLIAMPSYELAIIVFGITCLIENIGWIIVYLKNRKLLMNADKDPV